MATGFYNRGKTRILAGDTPLDTGTIRVLVVSGTKTGATNPDLNTVADLDAVASVVVNLGGGVALANKTVTQDDTNDRVNADADNVAFPAVAGVTGLMHVYYDEGGGTDATRHLIGWDDTNWGAGVPLDGGVNITISDWLRG